MSYKSTNPVTGETVAEFANHSDVEINNAIAGADAVYRSNWSQGGSSDGLKFFHD